MYGFVQRHGVRVKGITKARRDTIQLIPAALRHSQLTWWYFSWQSWRTYWLRFPTLDTFLKHASEVHNTSPEMLKLTYINWYATASPLSNC